MDAFGLSIYQPLATPETPAARLAHLDIAAERASEKGSTLLICPELYLLGGTTAEAVFQRAEPATGEYAERASEIAFLHGITLIFGYPEKADGKIYNSAACISTQGAVLANHRKTNLNYGAEKGLFLPGEDITIFDHKGWKIALMHDSELELPDLGHAAVMAGAEVFVVLSALGTGRPIAADSLLATRAFENKSYLAFANFAAPLATGKYCGHTAIYGPDGQSDVVASSGHELITTRLDPARLDLARRGIPYANDRRSFTDSEL